ncbi:hypothetical protein KHC33_02145 [Methanospirillum sp. J.3.6.1-F.2.7.3]|uniref:Uncharacterized protein n=1 Tax=Methanospirillum purgamenti TaxID=2834276 RepID=A0A8E7B2M0_9EURY|nr:MULTISPECIES: hypothetical protein [Methanospirillum]MDX8549351.1 hypothetical protein [Methanospirillum hungatei]QVV89358.1 hypothetical protein KHC33_02145 [Methanospirillum sp. J.3.6.1-F.2.7.3]
MIELVLAAGCGVTSIINVLCTVLLWMRSADQAGIISVVRTDEDGDVTVRYPFLSREK